MQEFISQINSIVQSNQILSTVAGGSIIVWLVSNIKTIFNRLVAGVTALISFRIVNTYEDARGTGCGSIPESQCIFNSIVASSRVLWERTKHLDLSSHWCYDKTHESTDSRIADLTYGFSIRVMFGKLVLCTRSLEKSQKITVTTTLRVFFASKEGFMKKLRDSIEVRLRQFVEDQAMRNTIRVYNGECECGEKMKREMDTIFTNNGEHYELLDAIKTFIDRKDLYQKLSYPYNFSALLYGDPGCGKTSTILAIASALHKDITYVNLSKITLEKLISRLNNASGDIVVFEDIDALTTSVGETRELEQDEAIPDLSRSHNKLATPTNSLKSFAASLVRVSLSDLLNITDGLLASDGTISLFTTNHIERLDPALLRSGRMNKLIKFSNLTQETSAKMLKANLDWEVEPKRLKDGINPAELQSAILNAVLGKETREDIEKKFFASAN